MKRSLYIDPATRDIATENFNLRFTKTLTEYTSQKIESKLKTFLDEWFLDRDIGLPYFQRIFKKKADLDDIDSIFRTEINSLDEVVEILEFTTDYNNALRKYSVTFKAKIQDPETGETGETGLITI